MRGGYGLTIGERIRQARNEKGLTQKQLGSISGTSEITIRQYELGKRQPRIEQLQRIADALNISAYDLIENAGDTFDPLLPASWRGMGLEDTVFDENALRFFLEQLIHYEEFAPEKYEKLKKIMYLLAFSSGLGEILYDYGSIYDDKEVDAGFEYQRQQEKTPGNHLIEIFDTLNDDGQQKAIERVEELTEIPRYRRQEPAQPPAQKTIDSTEGKDTPAAQDAPEGAEEGE